MYIIAKLEKGTCLEDFFWSYLKKKRKAGGNIIREDIIWLFLLRVSVHTHYVLSFLVKLGGGKCPFHTKERTGLEDTLNLRGKKKLDHDKFHEPCPKPELV